LIEQRFLVLWLLKFNANDTIGIKQNV
ncbi:MAG: hypothetical protein Q614_SASC00309G0001, partial [Staphylococcus sp. DORA_6_22]